MPRIGVALSKLVARSGTSKRVADRLVAASRVIVNGHPCRAGGTRVLPDDVVEVDGRRIDTTPAPIVPRLWRYHKPIGLITTHSDPQGRPTVFASLPADLPRVVSVGRLDVRSEGLLLLTDAGSLAASLERPSSGLVRTYEAHLALGKRDVTQQMIDELAAGLIVDETRYRPIVARALGTRGVFQMELTEGKKHEVRNAWRHLGFDVSRLVRTGYGPFVLGSLAPGEVAEVAPGEVEPLSRQIGKPARKQHAGRAPGGSLSRAIADTQTNGA